jgi:hypothetical protein
MDGSEQREGKKLRIAMLGSRGIPHTYSGYEIFPCWNLRAARSVASGPGVIVNTAAMHHVENVRRNHFAPTK